MDPKFHIFNMNTKKYWKAEGKGTTDDRKEAYEYNYQEALGWLEFHNHDFSNPKLYLIPVTN